MKIEIEVSDEYATRHIRIFAGIVPIARKYAGKPWEIKTQWCSMCGTCCTKLGEEHIFKTVDGVCEKLEEVGTEIRCSLGVNRPFG